MDTRGVMIPCGVVDVTTHKYVRAAGVPVNPQLELEAVVAMVTRVLRTLDCNCDPTMDTVGTAFWRTVTLAVPIAEAPKKLVSVSVTV